VTVPLSVLDLAIVGRGETPADAFAGSVRLARAAERLGYRRVWYAEHHNMAMIASSAPAVLIAHVAAHTSTIRLGAGGVMLPNHAPLTIAEQYGTLATLHPGRIDLGLGRAPGSDHVTMRAMRRDHTAADRFVDDVLELQGYLRGASVVPGVAAVPGAGTDVPLYVLGSSLYGAQVAAALGLPFAFASHFAPAALEQAVDVYRSQFRPSAVLDEPYAMAALNVVCAATDDEADDEFRVSLRARVARFLGRAGGGAGGSSGGSSGELSDDEAEALVHTVQGQQIAQMMRYTAIGSPERVTAYMGAFAEFAGADELIVACASPTLEGRVRTLELVAPSLQPTP
jgi:luciferase family oxidoreductase group 1